MAALLRGEEQGLRALPVRVAPAKGPAATDRAQSAVHSLGPPRVARVRALLQVHSAGVCGSAVQYLTGNPPAQAVSAGKRSSLRISATAGTRPRRHRTPPATTNDP